MKTFTQTATVVTFILALLFMYGCSNDDPALKTDYGKLRIGRMDLSGAVSIGLKGQSNSSRAIDGEYLSAGLYKVDASGNISAVGVYFTTDTLGNRLEHEETLRIVPKHLFDLTDNYMLVVMCDYYDSDGDLVGDHSYTDNNDVDHYIKQDVPYKDLLVRKSDGKIWCVDNISDILYWCHCLDLPEEEFGLRGKFKEDSHGSLYYRKGYVYKFNLQESSSSFEQITSSWTFVDWFIADNGVIWSPVMGGSDAYRHFSLYMKLLWPHSGFQLIENRDTREFVLSNADSTIEYSIDIPDIEYEGKIYSDLDITTEYSGDCVFSYEYQPYCLVYNHTFINKYKALSDDVNQYIIENVKSLWPVPFRLFKLDIGNTPGHVKLLNENIDWNDYPNNLPFPFYNYYGSIGSVYEGDGYVLFTYLIKEHRNSDNSQCWIARLDWTDKKLSFIKRTPYPINFLHSISYDGKVWVIKDSIDNFGAYWFDPISLEDGFVKFNVAIPSYIDMRVSKEMYNNGKITYSGQDPFTGNHVKIVIDITTGEAVTDTQDPEMLFETLINLN